MRSVLLVAAVMLGTVHAGSVLRNSSDVDAIFTQANDGKRWMIMKEKEENEVEKAKSNAIVSDQLSVPTDAADSIGARIAFGLQTAFVAEAHEDTSETSKDAISKPRVNIFYASMRHCHCIINCATTLSLKFTITQARMPRM